jgi:ATP-dependent helicase HrpB
VLLSDGPGAGDAGAWAGLPVRASLPRLLTALDQHGTAVLVAPPGTGKTTLVPLAVADHLAGAAGSPAPGRVIVAEPRRIAVRAAARRMAALLDEPVGERIGYTVRGESRTSARTLVEIVTTGVLLQRLQRDPDLPGVAAIMVDECHERHLETDLVLAFAVDVRAALRPGLRLLAASATAQADRIAAVLGSATPDGTAPVVTAEGGLYPVGTVWCPPPPGIPPPHGLRVDPRFLDHVAAVVRRALAEPGGTAPGDVLVFLPGAAEIAAVSVRLTGTDGGRSAPADAVVLPLHGRLPAAAQDAALRPIPGRRRVVLATSVAESSLTVPGVRITVDSGLDRVPRLDLARGLGTLVTVRASRAAATQRAGRCGRQGPGTVYRCWPAAEHERLPAFGEPAVATADLTAYALHLACWGAPGGAGLALPDPPPAAAAEVAITTLRDLGAVDAEGRATARGRSLASAGVHPRLARALLDGAPLVGARRAAELVALLAGDGPGAGDDLTARYRALRRGSDPAASGRWREEASRLARAIPAAATTGARQRTASGEGSRTDDLAAAVVTGLAYPERLARARRLDGRSYLMAGGTAAELGENSALRRTGWLAIAVADRAPGRRDARILLAAPLDEETARAVGAPLLRRDGEIVWRDGDVVARDVERLGAIVLTERPLPRPDPAHVAAAIADGLRQEGIALLHWTPSARSLRQRLAACRAGFGEPWPAVDDDALLERLDVSAARNRADLQRLDLAAALRALLGWQLASQLDTVAPERVEVPSGSRIAVDYSDPQSPALPVRVQEVFGWTAAPQVAGRPLRLRLLSPAGRDVAVTSDLPSFWRTGYPAVRADLRGRYPRHPWPEDPLTATPSRRMAPRRPS